MSDTEDFSYVKRARPLLWAPADGKCKWRICSHHFFQLGTLSVPSDAQVDLTGVASSSGAMTVLTDSCFPVYSVHVGPTRLI